jgi:hypothetical protein
LNITVGGGGSAPISAFGANGQVTITWTASNCPTALPAAPSNASAFHLVASLYNQLINAVSLNFCVSNASGNHYFIPAKTNAELQSFYNAASGGRVSGISVFAP